VVASLSAPLFSLTNASLGSFFRYLMKKLAFPPFQSSPLPSTTSLIPSSSFPPPENLYTGTCTLPRLLRDVWVVSGTVDIENGDRKRRRGEGPAEVEEGRKVEKRWLDLEEESRSEDAERTLDITTTA